MSEKIKFSDYYKDENFKEKHKKYILEKVECVLCGFITARCNLTRHRKSRNCNMLKHSKS